MAPIITINTVSSVVLILGFNTAAQDGVGYQLLHGLTPVFFGKRNCQWWEGAKTYLPSLSPQYCGNPLAFL